VAAVRHTVLGTFLKWKFCGRHDRYDTVVDHFFLVMFPAAPVWFVFIVWSCVWYEVPRDAYIECWSRGDVCIVEKACGADGPLGKNPRLEPGGVV